MSEQISVRTVAEIVERIKSIQAEGRFFEFETDTLAEFLPETEGRAVGFAPSDGQEWTSTPLTRDAVIAAMADYSDHAWCKVEDHRGLSANRSVDRFRAWVWLLGDDAVLEQFESAGYAQYGAPKLAVACEAYGVPIRQGAAIQNMIAGRPCEPHCDMGCGR